MSDAIKTDSSDLVKNFEGTRNPLCTFFAHTSISNGCPCKRVVDWLLKRDSDSPSLAVAKGS